MNNEPYLWLLWLKWDQDIFRLALPYHKNVSNICSCPSYIQKRYPHDNKHESTNLPSL